MGERKMISERDAVLREREAVQRTINEVWWRIIRDRGDITDWEGSDNLAARLYPLPKRVVPRVLSVGAYSYRVVDGALQIADGPGRREEHWIPCSCAPASSHEMVKKIFDLFERPTEEIDDDGSERDE